MELDRDMLTIISEPRVVLPAAWNMKKPNFFEGTSIRHIGKWYYLVYSATDSSGLNYAMSLYPDRDFEWKGRLHSTSDVGYQGISIRNAHYPIGNNHGGLVSIHGQWFIFNHRLTNGDMIGIGRQGVAEPVNIREDGKFEMAEATSCGLNQEPLSGTGIYPAYICCNLYHNRGLFRLPPFGKMTGGWVTQDEPDYHPPEPTMDHPVDFLSETDAPKAYVHVAKYGTIIGFKYFNLGENVCFSLKIRGRGRGTIEVASSPSAAPAARLKVVPSHGWKIITAKLSTDFLEKSALAAGEDYQAVRMPIFLRVNCRGAVDILEFKLES